MKKCLLAFVIILLTKASMAQYCGASGPNVCNADNTFTVPGITDYHTFPCVHNNTGYSEVVQVLFPDTVNQLGFTLHVDTIVIDSITNLPCGLCWSCDNSTFAYPGGSKACIKISGMANDVTGAYQINMYGTAHTAFGNFSGSLENLGFQFFLNVVGQNDPCTTINILNLNAACSLTHPAQVNCNFPLQLSSSNPVTHCNFDSTTLTVVQPAGPGYQYYWLGSPDTFNVFPPPFLNDSGRTLHVVGSLDGWSLTVVDTTTGCWVMPTLGFTAASGFYHVPSVCYATCDSSQGQSNGITLVFEKDDWFNNIATYKLLRQDSLYQNNLSIVGQISGSADGKIVDTVPRTTGNVFLNNQPFYVNEYTIQAITTCGDYGFNADYFTPSRLLVDTMSNGLPQLGWNNSQPITYSAVYIFSRYPGGNWRVRFSSINLRDTTWVDQAPDSTHMEYMLGYTLTVNCDPHRTANMSFSNFAATAVNASHVVPDTATITTASQTLTRPEDVLLYPNPAGEKLFVQLAGVNGINSLGYKMYNTLGQLITTGPLAVSQRNQLDIADLPSGIYSLSIQADKQAPVIRMFVKN